VHETTTAAGALSEVFLEVEAGVLALVSDGATLALPDGSLEAVMARYGAPFAAEARVAAVGVLDLGRGRSLRHVRHLAGYDVIARDYLVYESPGQEASCALATSVVGALDHLARAAARRD
jgi:hypothetical protein